MQTRQQIVTRIYTRREQRIRKARRSFWTYCRVIDDPHYYTPSKWHLRLYCETLQALYERRLNKQTFAEIVAQYAPEWLPATQDYKDMMQQLDNRDYYTRFIINLPPRSGKTRTLTHFTQWALGQNYRESVMTATYNDVLAQDFSRNTRDDIMGERKAPVDIVYTDIFPDSKMKYGNAAASKWQLDKGYQSYTGVGLGGSATGRGASISIVDDPIKDSKTAYNQTALDEINLWYSATYYSRLERGALAIVNHTRWAENDLCGYLLSLKNGKDIFILKLPAYFDDVKEYLDPIELSASRLQDLNIILPKDIYEANYNQRTIDIKGKLYTSFSTYDDVPRSPTGAPAFESIVNYTDTADTGNDDLVSITAGLYEGFLYVLDVYMTDEDMTVTEIEQADRLMLFNVDKAIFEGNNGGSNHSRAVDEQIYKRYNSRPVAIEYFHQTENKQSRIMAHQVDVMRLVRYPTDWETRWPKYAKSMTTYQRKGKNKHDDAPDATTGLIEKFLNAPTLRIGSA